MTADAIGPAEAASAPVDAIGPAEAASAPVDAIGPAEAASAPADAIGPGADASPCMSGGVTARSPSRVPPVGTSESEIAIVAAPARLEPMARPLPDDVLPPRPERKVRLVRAAMFGLAAGVAVLFGRITGVLEGSAGLLVATLIVLLVPTSRDLCRRVLLAGCLLLGWTPLLWWWDLPLGAFGRASVGLALIAGGTLAWVGWAERPGRRALLLLPRLRAVDLLIPVTAGVAMVVLQPWLQVKSATQTLALLMGGWDNVAHFSMVHMIRGTGVTVDELPPPSGGGTWQFFSYPQGFHADVATIIEVMAGPVRGGIAAELLAYSRGVALLVIIVVVMLVAGLCALPALRRRPAVAVPASAFVATVFLFGPGAALIQGGIGNFTLACALVVAIALLAVPAARVISPLTLAAIGGAVVGIATSWVLLLVMALPAVLVLVAPFRLRRWRATAVGVGITVFLLLAVAGCLARTAEVLGRVQAEDPLTIDGGVIPLNVGLLVASALGMLGAAVLARRGFAAPAVRSRVAGLGFVPLFGAAAATVLIIVQIETNDKVSYYGFKFMIGMLIVLLAVLVIPVVHLVPPVRPGGLLVTARTVAASALAALALTQVFGFTFDASDVKLPAGAPGVANLVADAKVIQTPPLAAALAFRLERAARLHPGGIPARAYYLDVSADRRISAILAAQWYLSLSDTWTSQSNYVAVGTSFRDNGPDAVADARWVLVTRPDTVVLVPMEYRYTIVKGLNRPDWAKRVIGI